MSLVGWWKLDGNAEDSIGGFDGYEQGSVSYSDGKIGQCYDNTADNNTGIELVRHGDFVEFESYYSFSLWFKSTSTSSGYQYERILARDASEYPTVTIDQSQSAPQSLRFFEGTETDAGSVSVDEWHHLVVTVDVGANESQIFIDGERVATGGVNGSSLQRPYVIGGNTEGDGDISGGHFIGKIDDVRLYDHVLSKKEVRQLSRGKILHYKFDNFAEYTENILSTNGDGVDISTWGYNSSQVNEPTSQGDWTEVTHVSGSSGGTMGVRGKVDSSELVDGDNYTCSVLAKNPTGTSVTVHIDWCDEGNKEIVVDPGEEKRISVTASRGTYTSTYRFFDICPQEDSSTILLKNPQIEHKNYRTPFVNGIRDDEVSDSSGYGNKGGLNSNTPKWVENSKVGDGAYDFGSSSGVVASNNSTLQVVGDLTISFWAKPFNIGSSRQNPIHKDYTNEYTMTMETSGSLSFYFNDSDSSYNNYKVGNMFRNDNEWVHVTAVRDMNAGEVRWYRNGSLYDTQGLNGGDPVTGGSDVQIGDGYTNPFDGILDDFRIYTSALTETDVKEIYEQRASIDDHGNLHSHQYQETKYDGLIADYTSWDVGTTGSQGDFRANGSASENEIVERSDPFGTEVPVWKCIPDSNSNADGGWNMNFQGDNSDRLRMTVFVKRTGNTNGTTYHGCDNGGNTLNLDGTSNGNPYFWSGNPPTLNDWYLLVGVVHPNSYTGGDMGISGVYDMDGNKVYDGTEYKWGTGTRQELRDYLFYCTDTSERQYFVYPRVDVMDGTEPSIQSLVNGLDSRNQQYIQNVDTNQPQPMSVQPEKTFVSGLNEVGPGSDSLVGYWKLDGDLKDYSGNGNHGTNNGAAITSGLGQSAYDFERSNNDHINVGTVGDEFAVGRGDFTFSAWIKFDSFPTNGTIFELSRYTDALLVRPDDGDWTIYMDNDANDRYFENPISASTGEWVHFLITRRNGTVEMYEDAQSLGTNDMNGKFEINQESYIGMSVHSAGQAHNGKIQQVRFHNRSMSQKEIKMLYNLTNPGQNQRVVQSPEGAVYTKGEFNELL